MRIILVAWAACCAVFVADYAQARVRRRRKVQNALMNLAKMRHDNLDFDS